MRKCSEDGSSHLLDEPLLGLFVGDSLELAEDASLDLSSLNSLSGSHKVDSEVHSVDTSGGIVLESEIDVLLNTKSEVAYIILN